MVMLRRTLGRAGPGRRGVILMVVLAMLTLFALVGITFVLVADNAAISARLAQQSESQFRPEIDPEAALALALGQLLYDVNDDDAGVYSSLRGHSLARNLYGWNSTATVPLDKAHTGVGRIHNPGPTALSTAGQWNDTAYLMNFRYFPTDPNPFLRDPEWYPRSNGPYRVRPSDPRGNQDYVGFNVPYTYPDHNNFFLAQLDPNTGQVVTPSYHREYLFGRLDSPDGPLPGGNPNWTANNLIGKYLTLRPRPADNARDTQSRPLFPMPLDRGGDVKNLDGAPGGADSIWIDIGAPVMTSPDGRKYKMLVAPLILDLGGRIDLNAVGNLLGTNLAHVSNQGWGVWEINPRLLVAEDEPGFGTTRNEILTALTGSTTGMKVPWGRYNQHLTPQDNITAKPQGAPLSGSSKPRPWARVDYNARYETAVNQPSPNLILQGQPKPGSGNVLKYQIEPYFEPTAYADGFNENNNDHPRIYNLYRPMAPNLRFPLSGMAQLLRWGGSGSEMQTSDLLRLMPKTLTTSTNNKDIKRRNLITLLSADLDRPGATPYVWAAPNTSYLFTASSDLTAAGTLAFPTAQGNIRFQTPPLTADAYTALSKINLNRKLQDYPAVDANGVFLQDPASQANLTQAINDRQNFARDLFTALRLATGVRDPATVTLPPAPQETPESKAMRWLAQLAVNIVDYIDSDDYSTPFLWYRGPNRQEYVFGTELPRLVINEVYSQYDNDPLSLNLQNQRVPPGGHYNVNFWVELHNPIPAPSPSNPSIPDPYNTNSRDCTARLQSGATPIYQLVLASTADATPILPGVMTNPGNAEGDPEFGNTSPQRRVKSVVNDWRPGRAQTVEPMPVAGNRFNDPGQTNTGFFLVGPQVTFIQGGNPGFPQPTLTSPGLSFTASADDDPGAIRPPLLTTILLRRLANPGLPPNTNKNDVLHYNPYITVDYVEIPGSEVNNGVRYTEGQPRVVPGITTRASWGRPQPYAALASLRQSQRPNPAPINTPKHTFFRHNAVSANPARLPSANETLKVPFDWLVHLDRQLISPMELWHVSAAKPHLLTQVFYSPATGRANLQAAPWVETAPAGAGAPGTQRLYRFLEIAGVPPALGPGPSTANPTANYYGVAPGGRIMGRVNINAMWNSEILRAVADPQDTQLGRSFSLNDVDTIARNLISSRSPGSQITAASVTPVAATPALRPTDTALATLAQRQGFPAGVDKPFWSLGMGPANGNDALSQGVRGRDNTILRFFVDPTNPGNPLNNKPLFDPPSISSSTTPTHPYLQKQLLTKIFNNLTTRSNVFAIWLTVGYFEVDDQGRLKTEIGQAENRQVRHRMFAIVDRSQMTAFQGNVPGPFTAGAPASVGRLQFTDSRTSRTWALATNTFLTLEPNTDNEETVLLQGNGPFTFTPQKSHPANCPVSCRANPGPWKKYDPRLDPDVVPFFSVID
jgi:hypothetical protein